MSGVVTEEGKPGYLAVYQANLGDGKSVSLQFNFALGATRADWAAELDKLADVMDRQIARFELPRARNQLIVQEGVAESITNDIANLEGTIKLKTTNQDAARRNPTPVAGDVANCEAQKQALAKVRRQIEDQKKLIADLEKKAT
jgi:hypothetical protein